MTIKQDGGNCWDECGACGSRRDEHIYGCGKFFSSLCCPEFRPADEQGEWRWMPWELEPLLAQHHCTRCPHCGHYVRNQRISALENAGPSDMYRQIIALEDASDAEVLGVAQKDLG